jgi:hypothetical protein
MTPYTDEWNKWRAGRRKQAIIERSKLTVSARKALLKAPYLFVPREGDNFKFVQFGGLGELELWRKR